MLIRLLITISIVFSSTAFSLSNTVDSLLAFADKQYMAGNYESAIKEYLRIGFFNDFSKPEIQLRLANSYYHMGEWNTARLYYDQVFRLAINKSALLESKLSKISSLISEGKYKQALVDLYNINDSIYQKNHYQVDILFGICYFGLENFEKSNSYFKQSVACNPGAQAKIDSIFNSKKALYKPNPSLAYAFSLVVPGLGQMYCGEWPDGLNSFFLTESLALLGVIVAFNYNVVDAIVSVIPWYQRYYMGGLNNTKELALKKRQQNRSNSYKHILDVIKNSPE
jgi:tetratricopeptide (TPR) repeat protein